VCVTVSLTGQHLQSMWRQHLQSIYAFVTVTVTSESVGKCGLACVRMAVPGEKVCIDVAVGCV